MDREDAKELYQAALNMHEHWGRVVWTYTGFAITINVAVWSYLLKGYLDSIDIGQSLGNPLYIGIAAAISAIVFGAWRYHNRTVDSGAFGAFTDLLRYEMLIGVPKFSGTQGSLIRNRPKLEDLVFADDNGLLDEQKLKIISQLVKDKHMAWRGWWKLEVFIFGLILAMLTITEFLFHNYHFTGLAEFILAESCNVGIFIGLLIVAYEIIGLDKEPNEYYINEAKEKIKFDDIRSSMNCINIRKRK